VASHRMRTLTAPQRTAPAPLGVLAQTDPTALAKNEMHFISMFVDPLWTSMSKVFPTLHNRVHQMAANMQTYRANVIQHEEAESMRRTASRSSSLNDQLAPTQSLQIHYLLHHNTSQTGSISPSPTYAVARAQSAGGAFRWRRLRRSMSRTTMCSPGPLSNQGFAAVGKNKAGRLSVGDMPVHISDEMMDLHKDAKWVLEEKAKTDPRMRSPSALSPSERKLTSVSSDHSF
jgi:hypothetical protein